MRLIYTTDLHGSEWKYLFSLFVALDQNTEAIVNGGDLYPKSGDLFHQDRFVTGFFRDHLSEVAKSGLRYLCMPGNDDLAIFDPLLEQTCTEFGHVCLLNGKSVHLNGYEFIGMDKVTDYPFQLKDRCRMDLKDSKIGQQYGHGVLSQSDKSWLQIKNWQQYAAGIKTIAEELEDLPKPADPSKTVYVIHEPPTKLGLDQVGFGIPVGSQAVYDFLGDRQPLLSLHGHIHESPKVSGKWTATIGRTTCVQPGQDRDTFTYVVVELGESDNDVKCERFVKQFRDLLRRQGRL